MHSESLKTGLYYRTPGIPCIPKLGPLTTSPLCRPGNSLSSSLVSPRLFPTMPPLPSLLTPFSDTAPWDRSRGALRPAGGVASLSRTVLHIINLPKHRAELDRFALEKLGFKPQRLSPLYDQAEEERISPPAGEHQEQHRAECIPSPVAKHEEKHAEYDAGDADVDPDDDAGGGGLALLILHTVTGRVQSWKDKQRTNRSTPRACVLLHIAKAACQKSTPTPPTQTCTHAQAYTHMNTNTKTQNHHIHFFNQFLKKKRFKL